jgi:protein-S-isoprenylcysteine O-methyltransferase Ste14
MSRDRVRAAAGSGLFLALAPGVVAGAIPYWLTSWESHDPPLALQVAGGALLAAAVPLLLHSFARFAMEGVGTPAPVAPTEHLVVGGLYRYVRNPMYLAVVATVLGQAALLGRPVLAAYGAAVGSAMVAFARFYEEPTLARRFGAEYAAYRRSVPGWLPGGILTRRRARPGPRRS